MEGAVVVQWSLIKPMDGAFVREPEQSEELSNVMQ